MKGKLLFTGTGASLGVPLIGCECSVCRSPSLYNQRLRTAAFVNYSNKNFLIDTGPDFRSQALKYQIKTIDGIIFTHAHHDHTAGIDDLRAFYYQTRKPLPILASSATIAELKQRYNYLFQAKSAEDGKTISYFDIHLLPELNGELIFEGCPLTYVTYQQGGMTVNGFRFGNLAYLSDIHEFQPSIFNYLKGLETLVISALRHIPSALHLSVSEAVEFVKQAGAKKGWLTHISHELEHQQTNAALPSSIQLAYDGLEIDFN